MLSKNKDVSVLFSGGSDSTLAAAICADQYRKVHLLNFHHSGMQQIEKSSVNVERLRKRFGKDKFIFKRFNIEELFKKLYYTDYLHDLKHYGAFLSAATCNICQLAMHAATIIYGLKHGIKYACDGYKREKEHVYIVMSQEGIKLLKKFYSKYGIEYDNPVHNILRTDWALYNLGVTTTRNVKFPYERLKYQSQHSCFHGILTNAYVLGYYYPLHLDRSNRCLEYFKKKLELAEAYIDEQVERDL